jgi:O-antigen/teichoic acid export membrane protein
MGMTDLWRRVTGSAVIWSWMFNGLRLSSALVLLPLLMAVLPDAEFGMYYVFLALAGAAPMMDFGFGLSVERNLSYAVGGAKSLQAQGVGGGSGAGGGANQALMAEVVWSARGLYRWLTLGAMVLLLVVGTWMVGLRVEETVDARWTWMAWGVHLVATSLEIYSGYWVAVLRGLNRVTLAARWLSVAYGTKLVLSVALLLGGAGLMAVPLAGLTAGILLRWGVGREVHRRVPRLGEVGGGTGVRAGGLLRILWPNSWRLGLQMMALFLSANTSVWLCTHYFGLTMTGRFGLSVQVMNLAIGLAEVWTSVKWPQIAQWRIRGDAESMRRVLRPRYGLLVLTYLFLAGGAVTLGPWLLELLGTDKTMLDRVWLWFLMVESLGRLNFGFWTTLIATENRIPALWPLVGTHVLGVVGAVVWVGGLGGGVEALVLTPLVLGSLFNFWWWSRVGVRMLGVSLLGFVAGQRATVSGVEEVSSGLTGGGGMKAG